MQSEKIEKDAVRGLQVIVGGLIAGCVIFAAIVTYVCMQHGPLAPGIPYIATIGIVLLIIMAALQFALLPTIDASARHRLSDDQVNEVQPWLRMWAARTLIGCAMFEGAAFTCLTGALLDGQNVGLFCGIVAISLMFFFHWPSQQRWLNFYDRQRQMAQNERGM